MCSCLYMVSVFFGNAISFINCLEERRRFHLPIFSFFLFLISHPRTSSSCDSHNFLITIIFSSCFLLLNRFSRSELSPPTTLNFSSFPIFIKYLTIFYPIGLAQCAPLLCVSVVGKNSRYIVIIIGKYLQQQLGELKVKISFSHARATIIIISFPRFVARRLFKVDIVSSLEYKWIAKWV